MREKQRYDRLDMFRILAAALVVAIHTSPLTSYSGDADFFFTRVLGRIAVPFFFMVTGQFVVAGFLDGKTARMLRFLKKIALLYGISILLYVPIGIYAGQYEKLNAADMLRLLVFDGTFYHLWYFPACMTGVLLVYLLHRLLYRRQKRFASGINKQIAAAAVILYVIGLAGDSYYGLAGQVPVVSDFYAALFQIFSYTRNGIFFAPLFLLLGVLAGKCKKMDGYMLWSGFLISFLAMMEEAFLLHRLDLQRHDSMYMFLPPAMFFLYQLLLSGGTNGRKRKRNKIAEYGGAVSMLVYIIHPAMILVVRIAAKVTKISLLVENSLVHYLAVLVSSVIAAGLLSAAGGAIFAWKKRAYSDMRSRENEKASEQPKIFDRSEKKENAFCCGRAWLELDHEALRRNVCALRAKLPKSCRLMPVMKADAYGHGAVLMAGELQKMGVDSFCVACVQEGVLLRRQGIRGEILILGYTHPEQFPLLYSYHLTQTVIDYPYAVLLNNYGKKIHVHIAIDTGMHRLGERWENFERIIGMYQMEHLAIDGLFTHLCASDTKKLRHKAYTDAQADAFYQVIQMLSERGLPCPKIHMQASYGVLNYPKLSGDYARVGIALYGILSTKEDTGQWQDLQPVLSLKARIAAVKNLYAGESAGYDMRFTAGEDMKIATLAIGYADGLPRVLSDGIGSVLIHGQKAPVIGRICMDQTTVDVTGIRDVKAGDTAVLIGYSGGLEISACDLAEQAGTITNEILSRMGARLERVVV